MMIHRLLKSKLLSSSVVYTFSNALLNGLPLLLLPVITQFIPPEELGLVALHAVAVAFMIPFLGLNVHGAIVNKFYASSHQMFGRYVFNALVISSFSTLLVTVLVAASHKLLSQLTNFSRFWYFSVIAVAYCQFIVSLCAAIWQAQQRAFKVAFYQGFLAMFLASGTIMGLYLTELGWKAIILSQVFTYLLGAGIGIYVLSRDVKFLYQPNASDLRHICAFGIPLLPHSLGALAISMADKLIITRFFGLGTTGFYEVSTQVSNIIRLITASFNQAWYPWFVQKLSTNSFSDRALIVKVSYLYMVLIFIFALALAFGCNVLIPIVLGDVYKESAQFTLWLCLGLAINGMYYLVTGYLFYADKTGRLSVISSGTAVLNIVASISLAYMIGPAGPAIATVFSFLCMFILTWYTSAKIVPMPWNPKVLNMYRSSSKTQG